MRSLLIPWLATSATLAGCGDEVESEVQDPTLASPSAVSLSSVPTETPDVTPTEAPRERVQARPSRKSKVALKGTVVTTARSDFGTMLFDSTGQAIYLFDSDATRLDSDHLRRPLAVLRRPRCDLTVLPRHWPSECRRTVESSQAGSCPQAVIGRRLSTSCPAPGGTVMGRG